MVLFSESIPPQRWDTILACVPLALRSGGVQTGLVVWRIHTTLGGAPTMGHTAGGGTLRSGAS